MSRRSISSMYGLHVLEGGALGAAHVGEEAAAVFVRGCTPDGSTRSITTLVARMARKATTAITLWRSTNSGMRGTSRSPR
jgi:hypothetical protein